jgi:ribosome-associated protein
VRCTLNTLEIAHKIVEVLEDKKAEDILLLDVQGIASFTDYFVIATGTSDRMLDALAKAVKDELRKELRLKSRIEGDSIYGWVLVDVGDIIVHLLAPEERDYYRLEDLWSEGKVLLHLQ